MRWARARWTGDAGTTEPIDRLEVQVLGELAVGQQCLRTGVDPAGPVAGAETCSLGQALQRSGGDVGFAAACGGLDELGQHPDSEAKVVLF
ncbi:MAG: hypothetical protein WCF69_30170 [Mycobacterium sp.]